MSDGFKRQTRPLAPSDPRPGPSTTLVGSVIQEPRDPRAIKPKRAVVHAACLPCRKLRVKCDGQRPSCTPCLKRAETCEYDIEANTTRTAALKRRNESLQEDVEHYKELYRHIRELPEYESIEVFRRIRATENPLDVLKQLKAANVLMERTGRIDSTSGDELPDSDVTHQSEEDDSEESTIRSKLPNRGRRSRSPTSKGRASAP